MKKTINHFLFLFALSFAIAAPSVWAELIYAEVKAVDSQQNQVTVAPRMGGGETLPPEITMYVRPGLVQFNSGIESLDDILVGDMIVAEAAPPIISGKWEAQSIITQQQLQGTSRQESIVTEGALAGPELKGQEVPSPEREAVESLPGEVTFSSTGALAGPRVGDGQVPRPGVKIIPANVVTQRLETPVQEKAQQGQAQPEFEKIGFTPSAQR